MAVNEILQFASTDTGTNLLTQAEYAADAQRVTGNQPGIARSKLVNKAARQANLMAAGLGQFIAQYQANNVVDTLTASQIADYLYNALVGSLAVTPPQFDNDTSLATTAFVQRALGNVRGADQYNGGTVNLIAADVGKLIVLGGGGSTINLPSTANCPVGSAFHFFGQGGLSTINAVDGQIIGVGNNNSSTSLTLTGNEYVTIVSGGLGNNWVVSNGTPMLKNSGPFLASVSPAGWQKLPSGLIIQWGTIDSGASGAVGLTFPVTFPVGCFGVFPVCGIRSGLTGVDMYGPYSYDRFGAVMLGSTNADSPAGMSFAYIALGY